MSSLDPTQRHLSREFCQSPCHLSGTENFAARSPQDASSFASHRAALDIESRLTRIQTRRPVKPKPKGRRRRASVMEMLDEVSSGTQKNMVDR